DFAGEAQPRRRQRRQKDRHGWSNGPGKQFQPLVEREDLTVEPETLLAQDAAHDLDSFPHSLQWPVESHAVPAADDLVATRAEPEDEAPIGDQVKRGGRLDGQRWGTAADSGDAGIQPDSLRAGG